MKTERTWSDIIEKEQQTEYFTKAHNYSISRRADGKTVFPATENVFRAFDETPFESVRVVILGQDPYHGARQAEGLSFSVPVGIPIPPSLRNIFKELHDDIGVIAPSHGHLINWAHQGVFLINAVLTVEEGIPNSHANRGWEQFTDAVIKKISDHKEHVVFLLWGNYARKKKSLIDETKHTVLEAAHPSPLSAYNGFFGCKHFSKANEALIGYGKKPIDWQIPLA